MRVNVCARVILNSVVAFITIQSFSPKLTHTVWSLTGDNVDLTRTAHEKNPVEVILADSQEFTGRVGNGPVPGALRVPGRTRAADPDTRLPDVSVTCSSKRLVLRVKRIFYGFSVAPEELTLGSSCRSNGALRPHNDLLFTYELTDCQSEQQVFPDYVVYKFVLRYVPLPARHFRSHRVNVGVECRFKRNHRVHGLVLRPTWWIPLRKIIRSRSDFRIQLMDDSWSSPVTSAVFVLGHKINVQVSTQHLLPGFKLFISSCYVTATNSLNEVIKYSIIDNHGFRFSRADNIVQFSFAAFQFIEAPDAQVSLHCELFVSSGGPSSVQKSCFYNHDVNRWISVFGQDSVCGCCDSVCNQTKSKRLINEGFVSSDGVVFTDAVTSPFSASASSALVSTRRDHDGESIWFEAKSAKEPQSSRDFIASVALRSSESQNESHNNSAAKEEIEKMMEVEKLEDVEILMATSKSLVSSERPKVNTRLKSKDTIEELHSMEGVATLGWTERKMMKSYRKKEVLGKGKVLMKTSVMVNETLEFPAGLEDLMEQGVVRKLDLAADPDYHFIPEKK